MDMFTVVGEGSFDPSTDTLVLDYLIQDDGTVIERGTTCILGDISQDSIVVRAHSIVYGERRTFLDRHVACQWLVDRFRGVAR